MTRARAISLCIEWARAYIADTDTAGDSPVQVVNAANKGRARDTVAHFEQVQAKGVEDERTDER